MKEEVEAAAQMENTELEISWTNSPAFIFENTSFFCKTFRQYYFKTRYSEIIKRVCQLGQPAGLLLYFVNNLPI
jgi:hypothetical protein